MPTLKINPESDNPVICYRQKLSKEKKTMYLELETEIPGSSSLPGFGDPYPGGCLGLSKDAIAFGSEWPKNVDNEKISIDACFSIRLDDSSAVHIICNKTNKREYEKYNRIFILRKRSRLILSSCMTKRDVSSHP